MGILPDVTGSGKSKMAVYKLVLSINRLVDERERRFQRKTVYLRYPVTQEKMVIILNKPEVENPIWRPPNRKYLYLSF